MNPSKFYNNYIDYLRPKSKMNPATEILYKEEIEVPDDKEDLSDFYNEMFEKLEKYIGDQIDYVVLVTGYTERISDNPSNILRCINNLIAVYPTSGSHGDTYKRIPGKKYNFLYQKEGIFVFTRPTKNNLHRYIESAVLLNFCHLRDYHLTDVEIHKQMIDSKETNVLYLKFDSESG
jgi:hypothetical protein